MFKIILYLFILNVVCCIQIKPAQSYTTTTTLDIHEENNECEDCCICLQQLSRCTPVRAFVRHPAILGIRNTIKLYTYFTSATGAVLYLFSRFFACHFYTEINLQVAVMMVCMMGWFGVWYRHGWRLVDKYVDERVEPICSHYICSDCAVQQAGTYYCCPRCKAGRCSGGAVCCKFGRCRNFSMRDVFYRSLPVPCDDESITEFVRVAGRDDVINRTDLLLALRARLPVSIGEVEKVIGGCQFINVDMLKDMVRQLHVPVVEKRRSVDFEAECNRCDLFADWRAVVAATAGSERYFLYIATFVFSGSFCCTAAVGLMVFYLFWWMLYQNVLMLDQCTDLQKSFIHYAMVAQHDLPPGLPIDFFFL